MADPEFERMLDQAVKAKHMERDLTDSEIDAWAVRLANDVANAND